MESSSTTNQNNNSSQSSSTSSSSTSSSIASSSDRSSSSSSSSPSTSRQRNINSDLKNKQPVIKQIYLNRILPHQSTPTQSKLSSVIPIQDKSSVSIKPSELLINLSNSTISPATTHHKLPHTSTLTQPINHPHPTNSTSSPCQSQPHSSSPTNLISSPPHSSPHSKLSTTNDISHHHQNFVARLTGGSIPKLRRTSSKLFGQVHHHPFSSTSPTPPSPSVSPKPSNPRKFNLSPRSYLASPVTKRSTESHHSGNSLDYDPISNSDANSFEDDGQEGSLQDALDTGDPRTFSDVHLPQSDDEKGKLPNSNQSPQTLRMKYRSKKVPKPGKQHGATPFPTSPKSINRSQNINPSKTSSKTSIHSPNSTSPFKMVHQQLTNSSADKLSISPPNESLQRPKTLSPDRRQAKESVISIAVGGPAALPSRLSGWFQQAFSSSTTNLPMLVGNSIPAAIAAPIGSPDHIKARNTFKAPVARENDDQSSRSSSDPKRSPTTATQPHTGNIRSLGNFFDKAVNYMFDTDAHSYDVRQTGDLWLMGGQRFVGIWKFDEHRDQHVGAEDNSYQYGHSFGGGGSGSDASHPAPHTKKRSALRRATVGKTKGLFKNPHHQSHASSFEALRKSSDPANLNSGVTFSPSPTPSPEPLSNQTSLNRVTNSASSLPSTVTHSYPPLFYHAFVSVIGLTYRCDFPPIPCSSDRLKSTGISGAGARVGGMLASLSLSIGRAGKRSKHASDRSRSPSPNLAFDSNDAENKHPDSVFPRGLTTDVGWGCMLRTGQSLLANSLLVAHLGRDWRRPLASITDQPDSAPTEPIYARLLSWFIDSSSSFAPFSVHRFALKGKELGKEVGEWFGPSTASGAIKALTNNFIPAGIGVVTDVDGTVYRSDVYAASVFPNPYGGQNRRSEGLSATTWERPVLILVNLRLGLDGVNPSYYEAIKATFTFPQSVGIAGGRPSSSYYFCGFQGDSLFYIDPHHSRSAIPLEDPPTPLRVLAQKTVLGSRLSDLTAKTDGDWEQISSNDTDSLLSGSGGSEARSRPRAHTQSSQLHNLSNFSRKSASRPSECSNDDLEEFYVRAYPDSVLRTFHPEKVRRMTLSALDPSMLVGFLVRDSADWEDLTARIRSFKPPLFHIAERTPSWMRSDPDPTSVRRSNDFRPSDDSDLGVDSWSEPDEWTAASRNDETSFAEANDIAGGFDRDETDDDIRDEREEDRQGQERIDLDTHARSIASSSPVDDNGWDDVEGDWKQRPMALKSSVLAPSITPIRSDTVRSKTSVSSSRPDYRMRGQTSHLTNPAAYYRPTMTLPQQSFAQGAEAMKMCEDCDLSNSKEIIRDTREDGLYDDGSVGRSIINAGTVLASVFPTHQLVSSTTFPHSNRDEPRSRNVSAATVRARNSDEHLADNEEALNHGQRRRLDSKGSARALTT